MIDYNSLSELVEKQFSQKAFENNFFEKDDLISDIYIFLSEQEKELSEGEIITLLKRKYSQYFKIFDIEGKKHTDKQIENKDIQTIESSNDLFIIQFYEKILGVKCPECQSKNISPSETSYRIYNCQNCGVSFQFTKNTNLEGYTLPKLKNLFKVYHLLLDGSLEVRDDLKIKSALLDSLPTIINNTPLIRKNENIIPSNKTYSDFNEYPHQTETIQKAKLHFKNNNRGKIIHPCGSGKTYTSLKIIEGNKLLVVIPTRILLYQQIEVFKNYFPEYKFFAFGDLYRIKDVRKLGDTVKEQGKNIHKINKYEKVIVFITLKSFVELEFPKNMFDFVLFDEAHHIAGDENKLAVKALQSDCYKKALFTTATEKIYERGIGMDSEEFGNLISEYSLNYMIDNKVICDYEILNIGFQGKEVEKLMKENEAFFIECKINYPIQTRLLLSVLSLIKSIHEYPIKKIISYHASIEESILFAELVKKFQKDYNISLPCFTIHSEMEDKTFKYNLEGFTNSQSALISSVNCFQEGIDVKDVDAVLFTYPKTSKISIIQGIGRCLRKSPDKKKGYVILPYQDSKFDNLICVLNSIEKFDCRIEEWKNNKRDGYCENVKFLNWINEDLTIFNKELFYRNSYFRSSNFVSYEECKEFARFNNIKSSSHYKQFKKPTYIPKHPDIYYENFEGWHKFLNTEKWNFNECREWLSKEKIVINSLKEWGDFIKSDKKPPNIVTAPYTIFRDEWKGFSHFSGVTEEDTSSKKGIKLSYQEAILYLKKYKGIIKNRENYRNWRKNNFKPIKDKFPNFLYSNPNDFFENFSWEEYLSENKIIKFSFDEFKIWIRKNKITSSQQYLTFISKNTKLPATPHKYYKEWTTWPHIIGKPDKKKLLSYEEAKKHIKNIKINRYPGWVQFRKSVEFPFYLLPRDPYRFYKDKWISWEDFTSYKSPMKLNYKQSKEYILNLNRNNNFIIRSVNRFQDWKRGDLKEIEKFPEFLEKTPSKVYLNFSWEDFLSKTEFPFRSSSSSKTFWSYEKCKNWLKENNIRSFLEFRKNIQLNQIPLFIPSSPRDVYKKEWEEDGGFFKNYVSYEEAKEWNIKNQISSRISYRNKRPTDIPFNPNKIYKNKWVNWDNFLYKSGSVRLKINKCMSYQEAQIYIKEKYGSLKREEFKTISISELPKNFPKNPDITYKKRKEWISWDDFLNRK